MTNTCPVNHTFDLLDAEFQADPYCFFGEIRESPVFYAPQHDAYIVTRFVHVEAILRDHKRFSSSNVMAPVTPPSAEVTQLLRERGFDPAPTLLNADRPKHPRMRAIVGREINPRRLATLEPMIRSWVEETISRMISLGTADVYAELAFPLPAMTGFTLCGFPEEDLAQLKDWCQSRVVFQYGRPTPEEQISVAEATAAFWAYVKDFTTARIADPKDDFTGALVNVHRESPESLTAADIVNILFGIVLAAHETTTDLIMNGLRQLLTRRDQWAAICEDAALIPNAVEECLRYDGSVLALRRLALEDTEIDGLAIPSGATVLMLLASGNRDPRQFDDAEHFDIRRADAAGHLTFGRGTHYCQGAPLARLEMGIVLETLSRQAPNARLVEGQQLEFLPNITMRGPSRMLIELTGSVISV